MAVTLGHGKLTGRGNTFTPISSSYSDIASIAEITHIENVYGWQTDLEPTAGNYDFSKIGTDLDYLAAQGGTKKLGISLPWASFNGKERFMPSAGHWGGNGVAFVEAANGARILRMWDSTIRTKMKNTVTALKTYLNAHAHKNLVAYIGGSETAANNFGGESVSASTWQSVLLDYHQHLCTQMSGITEIRVAAQYSLQSLEQFVRDCYTAGVRIFGGPDIDPYNGGNYNIALMYARLAEEYGSSFVVGYNFEFANYLPTTPTRSFTFPADYPDATLAGTTTSNTVGNAALDADFFLHIINYAVNVQKLGIITWLPRTGSSTAGQPDLGWTDGVLPAIQDAASTAIFPYAGGGTPPEPPPSSTGFTFKSAQTTLPTAGTPPVAHTVAHSLPSAPKAMFLFGNKATANESNVASGVIGFGASDFTHEWAISFRANAANPTTTNTQATTGASMQLTLSGSNNMDYKLNDGTPDDTNINLSISNLPASAYLMELFAACGDGIKRFVGTANLSTQDSAVTITATDPDTAATFQPNAAIVVTINTTFNDTAANHALWSFGVACVDNSSATVQKCYMFKNENGVSPSEPAAKIHTTRVGGIINTSDAEAFTVDLAFTSTGCTVTAKGGNGTGAAVGVLLMQINSSDMDLVDITYPTATGNADHAIGGWLDFGLMVGSVLDTVDAIDTTNAGAFFFSTFTPAIAVCNTNSFEDNQATADDRGRTSLKPVYMLTQDGSVAMVGTYVGQDGTNLTINYSTAPGTAYKGFLWRVAAAGALDGSSTAVTVPSVVDLTPYTDYVRLLGTGDERKANGGNQISISYDTPAGAYTGGSTNYPQFSATDSAPSGSLVASAARRYWTTATDEVVVVFPASQETATAYIWVNASGVDIDVTAEISDGSQADYTVSVDSADTASGNINRRRIEVAYQATQPGESLTVTLTLAASNAVGGNMSVQAVALVNDYVPPADITKPDFPFGFPRLVSQTETSPGSGLYDVVIGVQLSEPGEVFGVIFPASNTSIPSPQQCESGTDGNDSTTGRVARVTNTAIDLFEEVFLTFEDVPEGVDYVAYVAAIDNAAPSGNYSDASYSILFTTPSSGNVGGEGTYSATTGIIRTNGNAVTDTAVVYSWVEDDIGEYSTATFVDGTGTTSSTGTLTITRPTTNTGRIIISDAATGAKIWTEELTPA